MSFSFGVPKTATGFTLPTITASTTPVAGTTPSEGAGDNKLPTKTTPSLFSSPGLGTQSFSLAPGGPTSKASLLPQPQQQAAPTLNFGLGSTTTTTPAATGAGVLPKLSFSTPSATVAATPQFSLGATTAVSTSATLTSTSFAPILGTSTTLPTAASLATTSTAPLKLTTTSLPVATSVPTTGLSLAATTASAQPSTTTSTSATTIPATGSLTYTQLEDSINKWSVDLEEQGKFFINQAKQLNAWDHLLVANGNKISTLNETIEKVKLHQKQLDQELDFVLAQQNELEELSGPLEKQLADIPIADQNRFEMYQLSEVVDSQLKQMSEDLKEIVEHLNEANKNEDISDPVIQISRILNAHMNSLQWIDQNTSQITTQLEHILKLHDVHKKNHFN